MLFPILKDYLEGIIQSIRLDVLLGLFWKFREYRKLYMHVILLNLSTYMTLMILENLYRYYPINIVLSLYLLTSLLVHVFLFFNNFIYYIDMINISRRYSIHPLRQAGILNNISIGIAIFSYQALLFLTSIFMQQLFSDRPVILFLCNSLFMISYHSLYCYNYLWDHLYFSLSERIHIYQNYWPYFSGYVTIVSLFYHFSFYYPICTAIYNIYLFFITSLVYHIELEKKHIKYPRIKTPLPYILKCCLDLIKK